MDINLLLVCGKLLALSNSDLQAVAEFSESRSCMILVRPSKTNDFFTSDRSNSWEIPQNYLQSKV